MLFLFYKPTEYNIDHRLLFPQGLDDSFVGIASSLWSFILGEEYGR
jgi:hypothetical protein